MYITSDKHHFLVSSRRSKAQIKTKQTNLTTSSSGRNHVPVNGRKKEDTKSYEDNV